MEEIHGRWRLDYRISWEIGAEVGKAHPRRVWHWDRDLGLHRPLPRILSHPLGSETSLPAQTVEDAWNEDKAMWGTTWNNKWPLDWHDGSPCHTLVQSGPHFPFWDLSQLCEVGFILLWVQSRKWSWPAVLSLSYRTTRCALTFQIPCQQGDSVPCTISRFIPERTTRKGHWMWAT